MNDLTKMLRAAFSRPLPGLEAQLRMAPRPRVGWDPASIPTDVRDAAALLLVYPHEGVLRMPLTVRAAALRNHTGQVSLPGGRVEAGESFDAAALREAEEEVGIDGGSVEVLGHLTPLHIPVSRFLLHVVVAVTEVRPVFRRAEVEVARIIEATVPQLLDPTLIKRERHTHDYEDAFVEIDVPFYDVEGEKVWGATAMVLSEFCAILSAR